MYKEPFKILKEKVPFLEFIFRSVKLIRYPKVENESEFLNGDSKFAIWDIFLSVSLFTTLVMIISLIVSDNSITVLLSIFKSQLLVIVSFGYYAYVSTFCFFIITCVLLKCLKRKSVRRLSYLLAMHYARFYALFLFLFFPIILFNIHLMLNGFTTLESYIPENLGRSIIFFIVYIVLIFWCCVKPLKDSMSLFSNAIGSYLCVLILLFSSLSFNQFAPFPFPEISLNKKEVCNIYKSSPKYKSLPDKIRIEFESGECKI